jgi:RNAse (barnase) inhibitor barstar
MPDPLQELTDARGVVRWSGPESLADLEELSEQLDRRCVVLEAAEVEDTSAFLDLCSQGFGVPDWFEMNWDSLEECVTEADEGEGLLVIWSDWAGFADAEPEDFATAMDIFASPGLLNRDVPYSVILLGAPPLVVPPAATD